MDAVRVLRLKFNVLGEELGMRWQESVSVCKSSQVKSNQVVPFPSLRMQSSFASSRLIDRSLIDCDRNGIILTGLR
jgi:hypothetical protein